MYDLTEKDVESLVKKLEKNEEFVYDLNYLVECGLKYIYGDIHLNDSGAIIPCKCKFSEMIKKNIPHQCNKRFFKTKVTPIQLENELKSYTWVESNIAALDNKNTLHGFFVDKPIFSAEVKNATSLDSTFEKIFLGTKSGDLLHFDPFIHSFNTQSRHSNSITSVHCIKTLSGSPGVLTSSLDGSIYLRKKIKISDIPILDVLYINDRKFIYTSIDNTLMLYDNGTVSSFNGHDKYINQISYLEGKNYVVSSSNNGFFGILNFAESEDKQPWMEIKDVQCSKHIQKDDYILGYGQNKLIYYDIEKKEVNEIYKSIKGIRAASVHGDLVVFSTGMCLNFMKLSSKNLFKIKMNSNITEVSFSGNHNHLLVRTETIPYIVEIIY